MNDHRSISTGKTRWRWFAFVFLAGAAGILGIALWLGGALPITGDPLFQGKPESEWIANLNDQQIEEWRAYGNDGIDVLIRGLDRANSRYGERIYRKINNRFPAFLRSWLPAPKLDTTQATRRKIIRFLEKLGDDAKGAVPVIIRTANAEESPSVLQCAISFFITSAGDNTLLNRIPEKDKKEMLPALLRAVQDKGNWGLRSNAAILLKFYADERDTVAPILVNALNDPNANVRLYISEALNRVAPDDAKELGATSILVDYANDPDDQFAYQAVTALGKEGSQPEEAVPALIEFLQSDNTLIGCNAVWALEWAHEGFTAYSDKIIPALATTSQRKDNVGGYARHAHKRWLSRIATE